MERLRCRRVWSNNEVPIHLASGVVTQEVPGSDAEYLRTKFLERIAHDLRGPAGVTLGALDEIERALGPTADELQPFLKIAHRGLRRILRSAERLDRTSHLEGKGKTWNTTPCDLGVTVRQVVREAQLTEGRDRVVVEYASDGTPCIANVDVPWVRAALAEIVSNALRFAETRVLIVTSVTETEVHVVISDDGPGFSGNIAPRFACVGTRHGLGLSLPIVQDVVRAHGGSVGFRDRVREHPSQKGTSVTVTLPRIGATESADP
jgi:signal transduction histidine kinase